MASIQTKVSKDGKKTFYVVVAGQGKRKWIKASSLKDAKILKREIEALGESQRRENLGLARKDWRVDRVLQEYLDYIKPRTAAGTIKRYRNVLNTFLTFLSMFHSDVKYMHQITPQVIESYQKKRLESVDLKTAADGDKVGNHKNKRLPKPQTVNSELIMLGAAFIWSHDREMIDKVPTRKVKKLRPLDPRQARILSIQECEIFLEAARELAQKDSRLDIFPRAFGFLLNTGLRSGELCNLTWKDVNLKTRLIMIRAKPGWTPKTYPREFFMNESAVKVLESIGQSEGYVFKSSTGKKLDTDDLRRVLIKAAKVAGIPDLTRVHDLRHTFSSLLQMNGVDPGTVATILGHKSLSTTMIYTHQTQEHLKKSIEKVGIG